MGILQYVHTDSCCSCDCPWKMAWYPIICAHVPALVRPSDLRSIEDVDISCPNSGVCKYNCSRVGTSVLAQTASFSMYSTGWSQWQVPFCNILPPVYNLSDRIHTCPNSWQSSIHSSEEGWGKHHIKDPLWEDLWRINYHYFFCNNCQRRQSPEEGATFLSKITWWWLNR